MLVYQIEVFLLAFFICYLIGALIIKLIHLITHDKSRTYRLGVIIFSLLAAAMYVYANLGR